MFEKQERDENAVAVIHISSYSEEVVVGNMPKNMSKIVICSYSYAIVLWTSW